MATGEQIKLVRTALVSGFPSWERLREMVREELGEHLAAIAGQDALDTVCFNLAEWAAATGRMSDLLLAAHRHNPGNADILALFDHIPADRRLEIAYLDDLMARFRVWAQKYTPLSGMVEAPTDGDEWFDLPPGFEKLVERGYGPERRIERQPVSDLRAAVAEHRRLIILGEPGAGKSTTLWRLAYDYAAAAREDAGLPLPVLAFLDAYTGPESALAFVQTACGALGPFLPAYLRSGRALLLLDALNQMPRTDYAARVGRIERLLGDYPSAMAVVTCRIHDYAGEQLSLQKLEVKPLAPMQQWEFVQRYQGETHGPALFWQMAGEDVADLWRRWEAAGASWHAFWNAPTMPETVSRATTFGQKRLWESLRQGELPAYLELGANPYLLRMLVQVYDRRTRQLPANRAALFDAFVEQLIEREHTELTRRGDSARLALLEALPAALAGLADAMQREAAQSTAVDHAWAVARLGAQGEEMLLLAAAASLIDPANGQVRFVHQLVQEYFAAAALRQRYAADDLRTHWPAGWLAPSGWEETFILLAGLLPDMSPLVARLLPAHPVLAARCVAESGGTHPDALVRTVQDALVALATGKAAPVRERAAAGDALNLVGDPRPGVGVSAAGLPDIDWVEIPAGPFLMGNTAQSDEMAYVVEMPQHTVVLPAFAISRYPITVAQFECFVRDGGYTERRRHCWTAAGWQWKSRNDRSGPNRYGGAYALANHPVVGVHWFEAVAFCAWLSEKLQRPILLPGEAQWEKAARGPDGRRYPWGSEITPEHANYSDTRIRMTSSVGIFPRGASPYGVLDMAGNVWERTATKWGGNYQNYRPDDNLEGDARRTVRGGSFSNSDRFVRCACRYNDDLPGVSVGFRVVSPGF